MKQENGCLKKNNSKMIRLALGEMLLFFLFFLNGCAFTQGYEKRRDQLAEQRRQNVTNVADAVTEDSSARDSSLGTSGSAGSTYDALKVEEGRTSEVSASDENEDLLEQESKRESLGLTEDKLEQAKLEQSGLYYFENMDTGYRDLYVEILKIIDAQQDDIMISTNDSDVLQYVFQCVYNDHPEIYWVDGYTYTRHCRGDEIVYLSFGGKYTHTMQERQNNQVLIDAYVSNCLAGISSTASDYEKVKYIYEYIISNTDYVRESDDNQNILSVFLNGESVCQGYAKAMQYLLQRLQINCTMVVGAVFSGEGHAWNMVNIDGQYYYVDATWGDASYAISDPELTGATSGTKLVPINYDYLNITTKQLLTNHVIDNVLPLPECTATEANYYRMENLYFEYYDPALLEQIFQKAYANDQDTVTFQCADYEVYSEMCDQLLNEQKIFDYLQEDLNSVTYALSDEQYSMSFWL